MIQPGASNKNSNRKINRFSRLSEEVHLKIVLVGDNSVGKTCMIRMYLHNEYHEEYEPTVLDVYRGAVNVKRKTVNVEIHDTSGDEHLHINR